MLLKYIMKGEREWYSYCTRVMCLTITITDNERMCLMRVGRKIAATRIAS